MLPVCPESDYHSGGRKIRVEIFLPKILFFFQPILTIKHLINTITTPRNQFIDLRNSKHDFNIWNQTGLVFSSSTSIYFLGNIEVWDNHHSTFFIKWNPWTQISTNLVAEICKNNDFLSLCQNLVKFSLFKKPET